MHPPRSIGRPAWLKPLATLLAVLTLAATSSILATEPAAGDRTRLTFTKVSVDGHKVTIRYTINRRPSHITGRTCFLSNGIARVEAKCGRLPTSTTRPSRVEVVLRGLPLGQYRYTVRATHKQSLLAKGTTQPFTVGNGLDLDQFSLNRANSRAAVAPSCPDLVVGADQAQTFTAGRSGELRAVSVIATDEGSAPDLILTVTTLTGGLPGTTVGTGTYTGDGSPDGATFVTIPLSTPAELTEGEQYAVVLASPDPTTTCASGALWSVSGDTFSTYGGGTWQFMQHGQPWMNGEGDLAFMTWMAP